MTTMIDLRTQLVNTPLLMTQESAESFAALAPESFMIEDHSMSEGDGMNTFVSSGQDHKLYKMADDTAIIPIQGTLLHRVNWSGWGITGYGYIQAAFDMALADPDVRLIVFDVRSGGGEVNGVFELAEHIYKHRSDKPSLAILDSHAYSAAYLLASAAGSMTIPKTGGAGSIGVVTMHMDHSKAMEQWGVKITFIHAGKHKVDGNPYEALPADVRDRIQARVDDSYNLFVNAVSDHRGMTTEKVKATEAQTFSATEALELGLVDAIASPNEAFASFVADQYGNSQGETFMNNSQNASDAGSGSDQANKDDEIMFTQYQLNAAKTEGVTTERARFASVLANEHYAGREDLAQEMLSSTDLSAEQINQMLSKASPVVNAEVVDSKGSDAFASAMGDSKNPEVGADAEQQSADSDGEAATSMLANYTAATGQKLN